MLQWRTLRFWAQSLEKVADVDPQAYRYFIQAPGTDPVGSGFVFLKLLIGNLQRLGYELLRQPHLDATFSYALADVIIDSFCKLAHILSVPFPVGS